MVWLWTGTNYVNDRRHMTKKTHTDSEGEFTRGTGGLFGRESSPDRFDDRLKNDDTDLGEIFRQNDLGLRCFRSWLEAEWEFCLEGGDCGASSAFLTLNIRCRDFMTYRRLAAIGSCKDIQRSRSQ
jgi:hypothetical protein